MTKDAFLAAVNAIAAEKPTYRLGHDGSDGLCDCIGLIIGSIRRAGGTWSETHGSNYAARNEVTYLLPLDTVNDLAVGEIVFKAATKGEANYNLPSRYASAPDQRDYYHVGVVTSTAPLIITHCTSPGGITLDTQKGKWAYRAWLRKVSQEEQEGEPPMSKTATVTASTGSNVNLRASASTTAAVVDRVPVGATVTVVEEGTDWSKITYAGKTGYMMSKFLTSAADTADSVTITLPRTIAEQVLEAITAAVGRG